MKRQNYDILKTELFGTGYVIEKDDLVKAAKLMAAAFDGDPSIRYLLGGRHEGVDDWRYFEVVLKSIYGKCVMISSDYNVHNLLILFPPELKAVPTAGFFTNGGLKLSKYFGLSLFTRSVNYENNCKRVKKRFFTPDTWYCMCFVVAPERQGQGLGSKLIKPALKIMDEHNVPLYLETHKQCNTQIYRHLGFDIVDVSPIPGTKTKQYSMLRAGGNNTNLTPNEQQPKINNKISYAV